MKSQPSSSEPDVPSRGHGARGGLAIFVLTALLVLPGCRLWPARMATSDTFSASKRLTREGISAMELGQWEEAESQLREAVAKSPDDADAQRHLAEALCCRGAHQEALQHMLIAAELAPGNTTAVVRAGELLLLANRPVEASELAGKAVKCDPNLAAAWSLWGQAHAELGAEDQALAYYQRALMLAPDDSGVLLKSAELYSRRGQYERCLASLHHLIDTYPQDGAPLDALLLEGKTYLALRRPQQAAHSLAQAARLYPASVEMFYLQAEVEMAMGRPEEAKQLARRALDLDSSHGPSQELLVRLPGGDSAGSLRR